MATPRKPPEQHRRPGPKPTSGPTKTVSVTLPISQVEQLADRYGSTYAGLRAAVDALLREDHR